MAIDGKSSLETRIALADEERVMAEATERAQRLKFGSSVLAVIGRLPADIQMVIAAELGSELGDFSDLSELIVQSQEEIDRCADVEAEIATAAQRSRVAIETTNLISSAD